MDATEILLQNDPVEYFDFWLAFDHYLNIPYNLYTIFDGCYYGAREIYFLALEYAEFASNLNVIYFNLLYNMGTGIKNVSNIVMYFLAKEFSRISDGFTFGMELGTLIQLSLYTNERDIRNNLIKNNMEFSVDYSYEYAIHLIESEVEEDTSLVSLDDVETDTVVDGDTTTTDESDSGVVVVIEEFV